MFGILLALASTAFEETANSIGKKQVQDHVASYYTFGFLTLRFGTAFLLVEGFVRGQLIFSLASLPTFLPRLALEILQAYVTVRAITYSDRGDFGFFRTLTIPILLGLDILLGYSIGTLQIFGMALIFVPIGILVYSERHVVKGAGYLLIGAVNAALTISLYKYDITHFNSVEAEQSLVGLVLLAYFFLMARARYGENPLTFLRKKAFAGQTIASGLSSVAASFAYAFAPASIILAAMRSSAILLSILTGRFYFKEKRFLMKSALCALIILGLVLLAR